MPPRTNLKENERNKIPGLSTRRSQVLFFIAENGPANIYQIKRKLNLPSYSTAHGSIKALEKEGLIQMQQEKQTEKGVHAKVYELNFFGLVYSLLYEDSWTNLEKIVNKWEAIAPFSLKQYSYFVRCGLKREALQAYQRALLGTLRELEKLSGELKGLMVDVRGIKEALVKHRNDIEKQAIDIWDSEFLKNALAPQPLTTLIKWYKAFRGNIEIQNWTTQMLKKEVARYYAWAKAKETIINIIESPQEPDWEKIKIQGVYWPTEHVWRISTNT